jgi:hypothetical protein
MMGGIKNISELEAIVNFKDKEIEEIREQSEMKIQDYKKQKA